MTTTPDNGEETLSSQRNDEDQGEVETALLQERARRCQLQSAGTELDLSRLNLCSLPVDILGLFPGLRRLNLRQNKLESLPAEFVRLVPQLVVLNLSDNALVTLPEHFGAFRHLQKLSLANNQLQELPPSFSRLHSLEELDLSHNQLQTLDDDLCTQFVKLKTLLLGHNARLVEIPQAFGTQLTALRVVDLNGNDALELVPEKLRRLHERNVILHSRAKRRELISRALRVRSAVSQSLLNPVIVDPTAKSIKSK